MSKRAFIYETELSLTLAVDGDDGSCNRSEMNTRAMLQLLCTVHLYSLPEVNRHTLVPGPALFIRQVHKRIQRDFDSRERSPGVERDDMGFCLYPILDRGGGGSGLSFSTVPSNSDDGGCRIDRKMSTGCYSFKPLEAPHGSMRITVTYRRGVDPKVNTYSGYCGSVASHVPLGLLLSATLTKKR